MIKFQWDELKAASNVNKHNVTFEEAQSVFYDEFSLQFFDEKSSYDEDRFILLGKSNLSRLLVVVHCERDNDQEILRIISARKATKAEQKYYKGGE